MIGFVGLGAMGSRMARRLLDAGHGLTVWNRDSARAAPLVEAGAAQASSPAEAARAGEAVVVMVTGPAALEAVTQGPDGITAGLAAGSTLIQMSTVGLPALRQVAALVPEDGLLDAPVLGSLGEAEEGTLRIFAAGPEPLVERWEPLLGALGTVLRVGPLGAGTAAKLVANATLFGVTAALGEALALASGLGLSRETAFELLAATPLAAQAERRRPAVESGEYPPRFPVALALKDAELIAEAAAAADIDLRVAEAARSWLVDAEAHGRGCDDYSALIAEIAARASGSPPPPEASPSRRRS